MYMHMTRFAKMVNMQQTDSAALDQHAHQRATIDASMRPYFFGIPEIVAFGIDSAGAQVDLELHCPHTT